MASKWSGCDRVFGYGGELLGGGMRLHFAAEYLGRQEGSVGWCGAGMNECMQPLCEEWERVCAGQQEVGSACG